MARVSFAILWVSLFCTLAYFSLPNYTLKERIDAKSLPPLETGAISRLWFSPSNDLAGIAISGSRVTVKVWPSGGGPPRERTLELAGPKDPAPNFAVSDDASRIAWVVKNGVRVEPLFSPAPVKPVERSFRADAPISSLAFVGIGKLTALYRDGRLELRDLASGAMIADNDLGITDAGSLLSKGSYVAAYSPSTHHVFVFDTVAGDRLSMLEKSHYSDEILSTALSPQGRIAVGMRETMEEGGKSMRAPGPIRSLAFYDGPRVLVGGDFEGIFLLSPSRPPVQASPSITGTTLLAANKSRIVFGSSRTVNVANYALIQTEVYESLDRPSTYLALALLGLLSAFAGPLWRGALGALIRRILRIALPQPKAPASREEEEGPLPGSLVDACLNGDCVLYAGAGFSAQGGLPLWETALREIAEFGVECGFMAADEAAAAVEDVSEGRTGAAADRIAKPLEGHRQELHTYLGARYRLLTELPAAHQLIKQIDFPAILTTTFDNLLDRAFPHSGGRIHTACDCGSLDEEADHRSFFVLKPFGDLDKPETVRLGPAQCGEVIAAHPACPEFISALFDLHVFLFLGVSLDNLERDLELLAPTAPAGHKHYVFAAVEGDAWQSVAARLKQRYGIEVLTYSPATPAHSELVDFITSLLAAMRSKTSEKYFVAGEGR